MAAHRPGSSPPTPVPPSFHCFNSVTGACPCCCEGAHGWVARICQPWEQSSSRSWLPIVEAPGCLRHPTSILAMQLLKCVFELIKTYLLLDAIPSYHCTCFFFSVSALVTSVSAFSAALLMTAISALTSSLASSM